MKNLITLLILFCFQNSIVAQITPAQLQLLIKAKEAGLHPPSYPSSRMPMGAPEQDCNSAIPVCQYTYTQNVSYSGYGNVQEIPNNTCLGSNELNSVWYVFTVQAGGAENFQITPNNANDDYDFALYDITGANCSGIASGAITPVRCNYSANPGNTGLSASGTNASEPASGSNQSTTLNVTTGQTYVLIVSNYSSTQNGYTLNFQQGAGSANIFGNVAPTPASVYAPCGGSSITLTTSEPVLCSSISPNGSEYTITGTGGPYTVSASAGVNCGSSTLQDNISITPALSGAGPWTLNIATGSDGNTLIDNCANQMLPTSINFTTSSAVASISGPTSVCAGTTVALTASNGSGWSWAGPAGFTAITQSISLNLTTPGTYTYTVTISNGTCGTSTATQTVTIKAGPSAVFSSSPNPVCAGSPVTFTNASVMTCSTGGLGVNICTCGSFLCQPTSNQGTFVSYLWTLGDGTTAFYIAGSPAANFSPVHTYAAPGVYTISLAVTDNFSGCSNSISQTVTVLASAGAISVTPTAATICPGVNTNLTAAGGSTYTWASTPAGFNGTGATVTVAPTVTTTYTVSSPGCSTPMTATTVITVSGTAPVTPPITGTTPVCPNATGVIYSITPATIGSTYTWTVPAGAIITAGQGTSAITVTFGATAGTISVTETNSCGSGTPVTFAVAIGSAPVTPPISGPTPVCPNSTGNIYYVTNTPGSTYSWTVPAGATITSAPTNTDSITVTFGTTAGTMSVTETGACGSGSAVNYPVTLSSLPVTSAITGPATVCPNATGMVYSVTNTAGSTYAWTVPAGATITSAPTNTNSITVTFGPTGGTVSVTETGTCGAGTPVNIAVVTNSIPVTSPITGPVTVCPNAMGISYSVINSAGSTYAWTVPAGATITSSPTNTDSIMVSFGATAGTISVIETSPCGVGAPDTLVIVTSSIPVTSPITGPTPVCPNSAGNIYYVTNTPGSTYSWTVPAGATITSSPTNTDSITVTLGTTAGTVTVTETSSCGTGAPVSFNVALNSLPATSAITGPTPLCPNATGSVYSVTATAGSTYIWTVPAGSTITSGQGTNSITVSVGATGGNISVTETNACGAGTPVTYTIAVNNALNISITPPSPSICQGSSVPLTVSGATTYTWLPATGLSAATGANVTSAPATTTTYTVTGTNGTCSSTGTVTITVIPNPIANAGLDQAICIGQSAVLSASGGTSYNWQPPTGLDNPASASPIASPSVTTTYTLTVTNGGICSSNDNVLVSVFPLPTVNAGPDQTINVTDYAILTGVSSASFLWSEAGLGTTLNCITCSTPVVSPTVTTTYFLTAIDANGCENKDTVVIYVNTDYGLYIPNAFTPNNGETNTSFYAKGFGIKDLDMAIFNRWGEKLFETNQFGKGWDGTYMGTKVEEGVYVYKIIATPFVGDQIKRIGHVTVLQ